MAVSRLRELDSLRGIAALFVLIHHVCFIPKPNLKTPGLLSSIIDFGGSGVTLFFILSGFSMALTWSSYRNLKHPFKSFYIARFFRIAPLFYLWLIIWIFIYEVMNGNYILDNYKSIIANVLFLFNLHGETQKSIVWAGWTIGVEMIFYLIFPFIASLCNTIRSSVIITCAAIALNLSPTILHSLDWSVNPYLFNNISFIFQSVAFLVGIVIYNVYDSVRHISRPNKSILCYSCYILFIVMFALLVNGYTTDRGYIFHLLTVFMYSILVYSVLTFESGIFRYNFIVYLGVLSYSVYLNHPLIVKIVGDSVERIASPLQRQFDYFIVLAFVLIIVIPLSAITERFVEQKWIIAGKKLIGRLNE